MLVRTIILLAVLSSISSFQCLNEKGTPVDWYFGIRIKGTVTPRKYILLDSSNQKWRLLVEEQIIGTLFKQVELEYDEVIAWNDEPAAQPDSQFKKRSSNWKYTYTAHSKGLIAASTSKPTGFLLSHSIPKFPEIGKKTINPVSNPKSKYGQHILCITLKNGQKDAKTLWDQLKFSNPDVYYDSFGFTKNKVITYPSGVNSMKMYGFTILTKNKNNYNNVYEDVLIPFWNDKIGHASGFYVESWGRPYMTSVCDGANKVINIEYLSIGGLSVKDTGDHSKWALNIDPKTNLFCPGDLNHMASQHNRGGSFFCI